MLTTNATISHIEYSPSREVTFVRCKPQEKIDFLEWQFLMIESTFNHNDLGKPLKKPYSIATTVDELQTDGTVGFVVKKTMDGFMSEYLTLTIHVGDEIVLTWPLWHMTDKDGENTNYLLVSTGSGVSPMVGLYSKLTSDKNKKVVNIFGERYYRHILPSVEKTFSDNNDRVKNVLFLSQDEHEGYRQGHVQLALDEALEFLSDKGNKSSITVFICGSPLMVDDVRQMLVERWLSKEQVKYEKY